jgi:predicted lysophospholipase L1 biosynthesis ABC-type transport system permease subunit
LLGEAQCQVRGIVERMEKFLALSVVVTIIIFAGGYAMAALRGH